MFTSLTLHDAIPDAQLEPQVPGKAKVLHLNGQPVQAKGVDIKRHESWNVSALPPGFSQQLQRNHFLPDKKYPVEHHVYSDGLASVSVFIERHSEDDDAFVGGSAMGGVNAYGRIMGDHSVTVVGEVPPVTVKQIAESLRQVNHDD
jgi:sigma-E factor negative regulatory protein RseB